MARRGPRIRVCSHQMSRQQEIPAIEDVTPKVGIDGVFGELENGEADHANDKSPLQNGTFPCWRDFVLRHGRKIPVMAKGKRFLLVEFASLLEFTLHRVPGQPEG